jgi:hypothetical protein
MSFTGTREPGSNNGYIDKPSTNTINDPSPLFRNSCINFSLKFSLESDSEFTFPSKFHRKLGQNLKRLEPRVA